MQRKGYPREVARQRPPIHCVMTAVRTNAHMAKRRHVVLVLRSSISLLLQAPPTAARHPTGTWDATVVRPRSIAVAARILPLIRIIFSSMIRMPSSIPAPIAAGGPGHLLLSSVRHGLGVEALGLRFDDGACFAEVCLVGLLLPGTCCIHLTAVLVWPSSGPVAGRLVGRGRGLVLCLLAHRAR